VADATQPLEDVQQQVLAIVLLHLSARTQRVCLRQREGSYAPRCGSATLAPFVTGRRDLVTCQQCLAIPLPWDGEAPRADLATASAEMVAWAKSVREPTAEELAVAEARTEAIKAALQTKGRE
jgi:hypothetical protein